ncbi:MAG: hypothetical protein H6738_08955 [Alphaproteobacteria bacterium]|nr:hypothetical protein [Alphaproteobacteria bacterium]MCB9696890.1 hypothetical protein [Alphaproteobacteria bacterium]
MSARRITGRHLLLDGPGAVAEVAEDELGRTVERAARATEALGWPPPLVRHHASGASVGVRARTGLEGLAVDLLEWAEGDEGDEEIETLQWRARRRANPALDALLEAFPGRCFVDGDELVTGLGVHRRRWSLDALPSPADVGEVRGIPRVTVTGTNGKTTTTRLTAHLAATAGHTEGHSSSDGVVIAGQTVERGDWTGPGATRRVLGDPAVTFAVLETARGGLLRRGLALDGADVAICTNVASEHLGEWGVEDLRTMARAKLVTARGLKQGGTLIVPAVSEPIHAVLPDLLAERPDIVVRTFADGQRADGWADERWLHFGDSKVPIDQIPITFGGTARHNVENALCATLAALAIGLPGDAISRGLRDFHPSVGDNPGRMNTWRLPSGALVVMDFAHNAHGLERIVQTVRRWPRGRRTVLLGQAGDRPDRDLRTFALAAIPFQPHRLILKDVVGRLHGRPPMQVPEVMKAALLEAGFPPDRLIGPTPDEVTGIRLALHGIGGDDVVLLLLHETLAAAVAELRRLGGQPAD